MVLVRKRKSAGSEAGDGRRPEDRGAVAVVPIIHLHWSRNPKLVRETTRGLTLCGKKVDHDALTAFADDATCPQCQARARIGD
jgi:hypothetical protein